MTHRKCFQMTLLAHFNMTHFMAILCGCGYIHYIGVHGNYT